jgi:hypothetical protein
MKMLCVNCRGNGRTPEEATTKVWCPTWITAHEGPLHLCEKCSKVFQPSSNKNAPLGAFFWEDEADAKFAAVEEFIPYKDPRFEHAKEAILNSEEVLDTHKASRVAFVLEGNVWLVNFNLLVRVGNQTKARKEFPFLFSQPAE